MDAPLPKSSWKHDRPFRVGDFEVHPASGEIRGWDGVQRLRPLLVDLLLRLSAEAGTVVRRETLLEDVWPRRMVNDEVLSRAMAELRTALGDEARKARYIETLPKIGYRLIAPVREVEEAARPPPPAPNPAPQAAPARPAKAIALLGLAVAVTALGAWLATRAVPSPPLGDLEHRLAAARPLTSDPGLELGPRFSPDGRRVAFALSGGGDGRIVVQEVASAARIVIGAAGDGLRLSPVFLPDGRHLAFWRANGGACAIVTWSLDTMRETATLLDCALKPRARFDLSADGRWLAFTAQSRDQFPAGLQVLEVATGRIATLTEPEPGMGDDLLPRFSPDGRRIAFYRGNESHRSLWVVDRAPGASPRRVAKPDGLSYGVAWIGAEALVAAADWYGFRALNLVELPTGESRLLGARGARFPDVAPDGSIVFESATYSANLWRLGRERDSVARPLWPSTRYTNQPELSPDGRRVAFASNRDGTDALYVAALEGSPVRIAGDDGHRYLRPHWSADGRSVHAVRIAARPDGSTIQQAVRIAADGATHEVLAALGTAVGDVRETRDGRWLLWGEATGHAMRLMRAPLERPGAMERLPWPLASHFQVNAQRVVLAQPQLATLTSCRLADLACEPLDVEVAPADLYHWALGDSSLFLRAPGGIARHDLATGRVAEVIAAAPSGAGTSIAVGPGERELLIVKEEGPAIDLMVAPRARGRR